jgi:hypothetical protein
MLNFMAFYLAQSGHHLIWEADLQTWGQCSSVTKNKGEKKLLYRENAHHKY